MATYHDVKAKIAKLEMQAMELLKKESAGVITKIRGLMSEYGLTVQDLGVGITRMGERMSAMKQPLPPKYRDPVSGKTWSGKGKAPGWIVDAIKKGKKDDFLIAKAAAPTEVKKAAPARKAAVTKIAAPKKTVAAKNPATKKVAPAAKPVPKAVAKPAAKPAAKKTSPVKKTAVTKKAAPLAKKPASKAPTVAPAATSTPKA